MILIWIDLEPYHFKHQFSYDHGSYTSSILLRTYSSDRYKREYTGGVMANVLE